MTLIVLARDYNGIVCYADSRISSTAREKTSVVTDHFPKIMSVSYYIHRINCEEKPIEAVVGSFGFAFTGGVLFAAGLYASLTNIFQGLFAREEYGIPKIEDFSECAARLANIFREDDIINMEQRKFEAILFGVCPSLGKPSAFHIKLTPQKGTSLLEFSSEEIMFTETPFSIGSGASSFSKKWLENKYSSSALTCYVTISQLLEEEAHDSIGGEVQAFLADSNGARMVPILQSIKNDSDMNNVSLSGININLLGSVGPAKIGAWALHFGEKNDPLTVPGTVISTQS